MMAKAARDAGHMLRFLLYGDELTPGNPLRPDGGRQSFCVIVCVLSKICRHGYYIEKMGGWPSALFEHRLSTKSKVVSRD